MFTALRLFRDAGFGLVVATNQSGVPRGLVDVRILDEIHNRLQAKFCSEGIQILSFHSAPYMTDYDHPMRKPNPGMLQEAAHWHNLDLHSSWMIGDRMTDIEAGHRAGTRSALIGMQEKPEDSHYPPPDILSPNLLMAAQEIVAGA